MITTQRQFPGVTNSDDLAFSASGVPSKTYRRGEIGYTERLEVALTIREE